MGHLMDIKAKYLTRGGSLMACNSFQSLNQAALDNRVDDDMKRSWGHALMGYRIRRWLEAKEGPCGEAKRHCGGERSSSSTWDFRGRDILAFDVGGSDLVDHAERKPLKCLCQKQSRVTVRLDCW